MLFLISEIILPIGIERFAMDKSSSQQCLAISIAKETFVFWIVSRNEINDKSKQLCVCLAIHPDQTVTKALHSATNKCNVK